MSDGVLGKKIVITGAASGIGEACARILAERGARLFLCDLNQDAGDKLVSELSQAGHEVSFSAVDVSQADQVAAFYQQANEVLGGIDITINNAGIDHEPAAMLQVSNETFAKNIEVNLAGVWYCMKQVLPVMLAQQSGHIINIASVAGIRAAPSLSAYSAAKHAVVGLSKTAAVEYAKANIRVNVICPSFIRTPMVENVMRNLGEKYADRLVKANPMKRLGEVNEVAAAIAWLCTDESSFMTGHSVVLDGGLTA